MKNREWVNENAEGWDSFAPQRATLGPSVGMGAEAKRLKMPSAANVT
jgi:hypothetical protein